MRSNGYMRRSFPRGPVFSSLLFLLLLFSVSAYSQNTITGSSSPCQEISEIYEFHPTSSNPSWFLGWSFSGGGSGTIVSPNSLITNVIWTTSGNLVARYRRNVFTTDFQNFPVTVRPKPSAVSITNVSNPACVNTSGNGYYATMTPYGYEWSLPSGGGNVDATSGNSALVSWTSTGTHTVAVRVNNNGCWSNYSSAIVNVIAPPTIFPLSSSNTYCLGPPSGTVTILGSQTDVQYSLFDSNGNLISQRYNPPGGNLTFNGLSANGYRVTAFRSGCSEVTLGNVSVNTSANPLGPAQIVIVNATCAGIADGVFTINPSQDGIIYTLSNGVSLTGNGGGISWMNLAPGSYTVTASFNSCNFGQLGSAIITSQSSSSPSFTTFPDPVCAYSSGNVYTTSSGMSNYSWVVSSGGTITSGGTSNSNTVTVSWGKASKETVSVNYTDNNGCRALTPALLNVTVKPLPQPIERVAGLKVSFVDEQFRLRVYGGDDATSFNWVPQSGVSFSNENGSWVSGRQVAVKIKDKGSFVLHVKAVRDGCEGPAFDVPVTILSTAMQNQVVEMSAWDISAQSEGYLYLDKHSNNYTSGCIGEYGPVVIQAKLDLGDNYNLGERSFSINTSVTVTAYYDLPAQEQSWTIPYVLTSHAPEQLFRMELPHDAYLLKFIKIKVNSHSPTDAVAGNFVRLRASYEEQDKVNGNGASVNLIGSQGSTSSSGASNWERTFSWSSSCADVKNYEFQLLHVEGTVDWSTALTLYVENSTTQSLALAEGSGDYLWRVRAVGTLDGGVTNVANYGPWSTVGTIDDYVHPEEDQNWIYSRTFTEGNRQSEQLTYANGLQQIAQQQTRIQGDNQIVATQTLQDFVGRNALSSLPVPVTGEGQTHLGYRDGLLLNGSAPLRTADFDTDPYTTPLLADQSNYYGGTDTGMNGGVASAEGYPYTRTLFYPDGTSRVKEQGGVGATHAVKEEGKTVKTFYSNPTQGELVMLFGKEAPLVTSVQKVTTIDANGTSSISYQTKDGKVIATALAVNPGTSPLTDLPSKALATRSVFEQVQGNYRADTHTVVSRKPLVFTATTNITVDYQLNPAQLKELCGGGQDESLVAYYPFDGSGADLSGHGNTATIYGGAVTTADNFGGQAYELDGNDDYIQIENSDDFEFGSEDFTVSMWVRKMAPSNGGLNNYGVIKWVGPAGENEWGLTLSSDGNNNFPALFIESGEVNYYVAGTTDLTVGSWFHVVGQRVGSQLKIYVNGQLEGTSDIPQGTMINNNNLPLQIGRRADGYFMRGSHDEVQIYSRALSEQEVSKLYQHGGSLCKTCDYTVEFKLLKQDDINYVHAGLPAPYLISAGECSEQSALSWNPPAFTLSGLQGGVNYVLEKSIRINNVNPSTQKTYIDEHSDQLRITYSNALATALTNINGYVSAKDMSGLYTYLDGLVTNGTATYDEADNQYMVLLGANDAGCPDYVFISKLELCEDESINAADCTQGATHQTFEQYAEAKLAEQAQEQGTVFNAQTTIEGTSYLSYVYFNNRYTNSKQYFLPGQLNTMLTNLLADNGGSNGIVVCDSLWRVWREEVQGFTARGNIDLSGEDLSDYNIAAGENNLLDNFLTNLEGRLQTQMTGEDICAEQSAGKNYFIRKDKVYGFIGGAETTAGTSTDDASNVDVTQVYRLIYIDDRIVEMANALRALSGAPAADTPTTLGMFEGMSVCQHYQLYQSTHMSKFTSSDSEASKQKVLLKMRSTCGKACEGRREEFLQAIIDNIISTTPTAKLQYYSVSRAINNKYIGVKDMSVNATVFDYSDCELTAMVDALIQNCINNYCQTTLSLNGNGTLGTTAEWEKITKAVTYNFDVQVKQVGQSCDAGWDNVLNNLIFQDKLDFAVPTARAALAGTSFTSSDGYNPISTFKDNSGSFYLGSSFRGSIDVDPSINNYILNHQGAGSGSAGVVTKLDANGNFVWGKIVITPNAAFNSSSTVVINQIEGNTQSLYIVGSFYGKADFDPSSGEFNLTSNGDYDSFLAKYDLSGNLIWAISYGNSYSDAGVKDLVIDSNENVLLTGAFFGVVDFDSSSSVHNLSSTTQSTAYILKISDQGQFVWVKSIPILGINYPKTKIDPAGNIIMIGDFSKIFFSNVDGTQTAVGGGSSFLAKFNNLGDPIWGLKVVDNGMLTDFKLSGSDNLYLTGYFSGSFDCDPSSTSRVLSSNGLQDLFLLKFNHNIKNLIWGNSFGGTSNDFGYSIAISLNGDVNLSGNFQSNSINLDPSSNKPPLNLSYFQGGGELFLAKYTSSGDLIYAKKPTSLGKTNAFKIYAAEGSSVYAFIDFNSGVDFDPSSNNYVGVSGNYPFVKYTFSVNPSVCPLKITLCFRFTTPQSTTANGIVVPEGMEDYVFNPKQESCEDAASSIIKASLEQQQEQLISGRIKNFRDQYVSRCADPALIEDELTISYQTGLHHFTLYYYDRAGNLMKTVPPAGVSVLPVGNSFELSLAKNTFNAHTLVTEYQYNSLGQLMRDHSPDANADPALSAADQNTYYSKPAIHSSESEFNSSRYFATYLYNDKGQLRFSRNAKQKQSAEGSYSYTKYDNLGRIMEVGEATAFNEDEAKLNRNNNSTYPSANIRQVTGTYYTSAFDVNQLPAGYSQRYLRNRVSYAYLDEDGSASTQSDRTHTVYSYDPHGNVEWVLQYIPGLPPTGIKYEYDLISGKVLRVDYNPGKADQFSHRYDYDANNRITKVSTSKDGQLWEQDASYEYYLHGPLKRSVIGEDKVQGMDYTYTVHGWLKALNNPLLDKDSDPNKDGDANSAVGRDAFGMALTYFSGDYKHTGSPLETTAAGTLLPEAGKELYNGNISAWTSNMFYDNSVNTAYANANVSFKQLSGYQYQYDELNRLVYGTFLTNNWGTFSIAPSYSLATQFSYDANGNILIQNNVNQNGVQMDLTTYNYHPSTNRLRHINEGAQPSSFGDDIENQNPDNYVFDPIGNLTRDVQQQTQISWTPYGKVKRVDKTNSSGFPTGAYTEFMYDAQGKRVAKKQVNTAGLAKTNYYVHDASGNTMAVYEKIEESGGAAPETNLVEMYLYGSDRIGVYNQPVRIDTNPVEEVLQPGEVRITENSTRNVFDGASYFVNTGVTLTLGAGFSYTSTSSDGSDNFTVRVGESGGSITPAAGLYSRNLNTRQYELKDHLGNVRTVVGDQKLSVVSGGTPGNYEGKIISLANYFPFGMDQPGRSWNAGSKYRYGFNGKERDSNGEWGSTSYDYGFRIYNPGVGKFLSVDPLTKSYPMLTPYQFASNTPIQAIDMDGLEAYFIHGLNNGTPNGKDVWDQPDFQRVQKSLLRLVNYKTVNDDFDWSANASSVLNNGHIGNWTSDRRTSAFNLAIYILQTNKKDEDVTLIGVSHGGNVAIQAAGILGKLGYKVNVITLNTPTESDEDDPENPTNNEGINDMIQIYNLFDYIRKYGSTEPEDYKSQPKTHERQELPLVPIGITPDEVHGTKNVDTKQIDKSKLRKLKPVPEENKIH